MEIRRRRGERARGRRKALGLTLEDLAERSGLSAVTLSNLERGEGTPTLDTLESLAAAYAMTAAGLLAELDDPDDSPRAATLRELAALCGTLDDATLDMVRTQIAALAARRRG